MFACRCMNMFQWVFYAEIQVYNCALSHRNRHWYDLLGWLGVKTNLSHMGNIRIIYIVLTDPPIHRLTVCHHDGHSAVPHKTFTGPTELARALSSWVVSSRFSKTSRILKAQWKNLQLPGSCHIHAGRVFLPRPRTVVCFPGPAASFYRGREHSSASPGRPITETPRASCQLHCLDDLRK